MIEYNPSDLKMKKPVKPQRYEYVTWPIKYSNSEKPDYYGIRTYYEEWNEETKQWEYLWYSESLFYPDGRPAP